MHQMLRKYKKIFVFYSQNKSKNIITTWIELLKDDNEYNKKKGNYITLEIDDLENIDSNHLINSINYNANLNKSKNTIIKIVRSI